MCLDSLYDDGLFGHSIFAPYVSKVISSETGVPVHFLATRSSSLHSNATMFDWYLTETCVFRLDGFCVSYYSASQSVEHHCYFFGRETCSCGRIWMNTAQHFMSPLRNYFRSTILAGDFSGRFSFQESGYWLARGSVSALAVTCDGLLGGQKTCG